MFKPNWWQTILIIVVMFIGYLLFQYLTDTGNIGDIPEEEIIILPKVQGYKFIVDSSFSTDHTYLLFDLPKTNKMCVQSVTGTGLHCFDKE